MDFGKFKTPVDGNEKFDLDDLKHLINILISEDGCPWDRKQTPESLSKYLIEESYEAVDAINNFDMAATCEELGDCLFQNVFISRLAQNKGFFSFEDVVDGVVKKMISRHTHIFGDDIVTGADEVETLWEKNKKAEKEYFSLQDKLKAIPESMPALMRAQKAFSIAKEAESLESFSADALIDEAINCLKAMKNGKTTENEETAAELLLHIANIYCVLQINAEFTLTKAVKTYINKFENIKNQEY